MINGKFYTGLTNEMMSRGRTVVNRQESHFFWPDETHVESVSSRAKRTNSKPGPITTNNNNNTETTQSDIKPKELFRKQLSSGIEFYDNVNAKTPESQRRRIKKIDNINLNNNYTDFQPTKKKLESFSSKIEFYDFEHEKNAKNVKPTKSNNVEEMGKEEIKPINESHDVNKKRISFQTEEKTVEKTKGILKNCDEKPGVEKVLVKPLRGLLSKNLSKSVENISKIAKNFDEADKSDDKTSEKLSTIIKDVNSLNLSQDRNNRKDDDYDRDSQYRGSDRIEPRRNNIDHYPEKYDSKGGYRDDEYRYKNEDRDRNRNRNRNEQFRYNDRYDGYDDTADRFNDKGNRGNDERRYERSQRVTYSHPKDTYESRERLNRFEESPIGGTRENYDRHDREYNRKSKRAPIRESKPMKPQGSDPYDDEPSKRSVRHENDEYSTCISEKPKHVPNHLRTNILFNGRVLPQTQRPMSVRNSAVTRVGVGLPDYE